MCTEDFFYLCLSVTFQTTFTPKQHTIRQIPIYSDCRIEQEYVTL